MRKQLGVVLAALLAITFLFQGTASAFQRESEWCAEDPIFNVLGSHFRITTTIGAPVSAVKSVFYTVIVPQDAVGSATAHVTNGQRIPTSVQLSYTGPAANGGNFDVTVQITVDAPSATNVRADLSGPSVTADSRQTQTPSTLGWTFSVAAK
jgi:hypothetical protein